MNEGPAHFPWATTTPRSRRRAEARVDARPDARPDRVALWAVFLALFAILVAAGTANATGGGVSAGGSGDSGGNADATVKQRWKKGTATYYTLFGQQTACGQTIAKGTIGVANNALPCGTKVTFRYKKRVVSAKVIDTGAFGCSPNWDLTYGLKRKLGFPGSGKVKYAVAGGRNAC